MESKLRNKRILFINDSFNAGGAERVMSILMNGFLMEGLQVSLVMVYDHLTFPVPEGVMTYLYSGNEIIEYNKDRINSDSTKEKMKGEDGNEQILIQKQEHVSKKQFEVLNRLSEIRDIRRYSLILEEFILERKFNTIIAFLTFSQLIAMDACRRTGTRLILSERKNPLLKSENDWMENRKQRLSIRSDAFVFQTEDAMKAYPCAIQKKGVIIPNPLDENLPDYFVGKRRKIIVNFCRFEEQKNIPLLIDAFKLFYGEFPEYSLELYGEGSLKAKIVSYIKKRGMEHAAKVYPSQRNLHAKIREYSMFVSTSDSEGLSNSMLEAMAIGLPVICTDCPIGGAKWAIRDHENGLLVPVGDVQAVNFAMREIAGSEKFADKISRNAVKIREICSKKKIVQQWIDLI